MQARNEKGRPGLLDAPSEPPWIFIGVRLCLENCFRQPARLEISDRLRSHLVFLPIEIARMRIPRSKRATSLEWLRSILNFVHWIRPGMQVCVSGSEKTRNDLMNKSRLLFDRAELRFHRHGGDECALVRETRLQLLSLIAWCCQTDCLA